VKFIREHFGLTQDEFADMLSTTASTISRWETEGAAKPTGIAATVLELLRIRLIYIPELEKKEGNKLDKKTAYKQIIAHLPSARRARALSKVLEFAFDENALDAEEEKKAVEEIAEASKASGWNWTEILTAVGSGAAAIAGVIAWLGNRK